MPLCGHCVVLRVPIGGTARSNGMMKTPTRVQSNFQKHPPVKGSPGNIRIVLADDREDLLQEIRALLTPDFEIVNSVTNGLALIDAVRDLKPDLVVSDIKMPGMSGIEACRRIIEEGLCSAAILLTMYNEAQLVREALGVGIRGYLLKVNAGEELIPAVRSVMGGSTYLSAGVRAA